MFGGCRGLEPPRSLGRGSGPFSQEEARASTGLNVPELQHRACRGHPAQGQAGLDSGLGTVHRAVHPSLG